MHTQGAVRWLHCEMSIGSLTYIVVQRACINAAPGLAIFAGL